MKAVVCTRYGPPEVLRLQELGQPKPKPDEVLIKVRATSVTMADHRLRSLSMPPGVSLLARLALGVQGPRRSILGTELAGEVVEVGASVSAFTPGDEVFAATLERLGAYAEYICLPADGPMIHKPENLTFEEAAVVPVGARTALYFLRRVKLQPEQRILIYGASGSVGNYTIPLAKYMGAEVTAVCSSTNFDLVRSLGADKVVDYRAEDFISRLETYDVVFVAVDKLSFKLAEKILTPRGTYVNITSPFPSFRQLKAILFSNKTIMMAESIKEKLAPMSDIKALLEAGVLQPVIDRQYSLEEIVAAHRYVDTGRKKGNVVITVAQS